MVKFLRNVCCYLSPSFLIPERCDILKLSVNRKPQLTKAHLNELQEQKEGMMMNIKEWQKCEYMAQMVIVFNP